MRFGRAREGWPSRLKKSCVESRALDRLWKMLRRHTTDKPCAGRPQHPINGELRSANPRVLQGGVAPVDPHKGERAAPRLIPPATMRGVVSHG